MTRKCWLLTHAAYPADGVTYVLRHASRTGCFGKLALLRQRRGLRTQSVATASATCARKPHHPPWVAMFEGFGNARFRRVAVIHTVLSQVRYAAEADV